MNEFLKTRKAVDVATQYLNVNNLVASGLDCKNWETYSILPFLKDGNICDLGSAGSIVLPNAVKMNLKGLKVGIDLAYEEDYSEGQILYYKGDLMATSLGNELFDIVSCLSVVEHEVNFEKFAKEVGRILKRGGNAFVSFDFWNPKPEYNKRKLYNLDWNILDRTDVLALIAAFFFNDMELTSEVDWTTDEAVINSSFCAPVIGVEYTFGILNFIKK